MGATEQLSKFTEQLRFGDIPPNVVGRLKLHLLDAIGAALFGVETPWTSAIRNYWLETAAAGPALVWGTSKRLPAAVAGLLNSTATHAFELDDRRVASYMHPASATLPAALAVADARGSVSGEDLITAITAGYEVGLRVGKCIGVGGFARGFYSPGISGGFSAAATAAKLSGMTAEQIPHVFHVTATQSSGLYSPTTMKRLNLGNGTFHGMSAVDLVRHGLTGLPDILERDVGGFTKAFLDDADLDHLTSGLGSEYQTLAVELKPYVSSRPNHTAIDAALALRSANPDLGADDIERIELVVNSGRYMRDKGFGDPTDVSSAFMSLRYCVAVAMLDGDVFIEQFTDERVRDPAVSRLIKKMEVLCDPELDKIILEGRDYAKVRWITKDGRKLEEERVVAKGHPKNPMSEAEVRRKFHRLMDHKIGKDRADRIEGLFDRLEKIDSTALHAVLAAGS